mgnify:CR=1 FL=1
MSFDLLGYGVLFYVVSLALQVNSFSIIGVIKVVFPFLVSRMWFVETYIILMFLSPFINKGIKSLTKRQYLYLIIGWLLIFAVWPSFLPSAPILDHGYGITQFITMYLVGGYIKLHVPLHSNKKYPYIVCYLICVVILDVLVHAIGEQAWDYCNIFNIIGSTALFVFFTQLNVRNNSWINGIGAAVFGIYCIHVDYSVRYIIWQSILRCGDYYQSALFPLHFVASVIVICMVCIVIEKIRVSVWQRTINRLLSKVQLQLLL